MKSLIEFGKKVMFYARVLSGYEERRIRATRLAIQQRIQQAAEKKAALKQVPEQIILSEMRRFVTELENLNKKLDETDASFGKYFESINKGAGMVVDAQLDGEKQRMIEMMKMMQQQALLEKTETGVVSDKHNAGEIKDKASS